MLDFVPLYGYNKIFDEIKLVLVTLNRGESDTISKYDTST